MLTITTFKLFIILLTQRILASQALLSSMAASYNGDVPIFRDYFGYYIKAEYNSHTVQSGRWFIDTISEHTLLPYNCKDFENYTCETPDCTEVDIEPTKIDYFYFSTEAKSSLTDITIDNSYWKRKDNIRLGTNCVSKEVYLGYHRVGIIGLGSDDAFTNKTSFSIYLYPNRTGGYLFFNFKPQLVTDLVFSLTTGSKWRISDMEGILSVGSFYTKINHSLVFDVHSDDIGFPMDTYDFIMDVFKRRARVCDASYIGRPRCYYAGHFQDLPSLGISFGSKYLAIPPEIYVSMSEYDKKKNETAFEFSIKALDPKLSFHNYVNPTFQNYIILGSNFMNYYYINFDTNTEGKKVIEIYNLQSPEESNLLPIIVTIVVLVCVFISLLYFWKPKQSKNIDSQKAVPNESYNKLEGGNNGAQVGFYGNNLV